ISLLDQLDIAIDILEHRKSIITSYEDLSLLITENNDLFDFSKQILLDLYNLTKDHKYLNQFLTIQESSLYNRIRARLNLKNNMTFANVPKQVIKREHALKRNMSLSIESTNDDGSFKTFFEANAQWNTFLDSLKQHYPKYYKMRYASISKSLEQIDQKIDRKSTGLNSSN